MELVFYQRTKKTNPVNVCPLGICDKIVFYRGTKVPEKTGVSFSTLWYAGLDKYIR